MKNSTRLPSPEEMAKLLAKPAHSVGPGSSSSAGHSIVKLNPPLSEEERIHAREQAALREQNTSDVTTSQFLDAQSEIVCVETVQLVDIQLIDEPTVRQRWLYSADKISRMAASLMQEGDGDAIRGQLQPVILIPSPEGHGRFEMVEGLTRLKAFKDHFLAKHIKAIVRTDLSREAAYRFGYKANEERNNLTDYDKGMSFSRALDTGLFKNQSELGAAVGSSRQAISGYLAFSKLPDSIIPLIESKPDAFSYNVAARLLSLSNKATSTQVESAAAKIAAGTWSFSRLSSFVSEIEIGEAKEKKKRKSSRAISNFGNLRCGEGSLSLTLENIPQGVEKELQDRLESIVIELLVSKRIPPQEEQ